MNLLVSAVAAIIISLSLMIGFCCGMFYSKSRSEHAKSVGQEVADTASETSAVDDVVGTTTVRRRASEIDIGETDARTAVLMAFLEADQYAVFVFSVHSARVFGSGALMRGEVL